jgi:arginine deiminase
VSEFDTPTDIITHCPSIETHFPYHLAALLFESPPNPRKMSKCHDDFRRVLHAETGAQIWTIRELLSHCPIAHLREHLVRHTNIEFQLRPSAEDRADEQRLGIDYVRESISGLDKDRLIDLILLHPRIVIDASDSFRPWPLPLSPLANLTFTRDSHIVTARGVVVGRFSVEQRVPENWLASFLCPEIGIAPIGVIDRPGTLEGSDFIPHGMDLAFVGVGLRTNCYAAQQLMDKDLIGTRRVVVVNDDRDRQQQRMHLGAVFAVCDQRLCLCVDKVADDDPKFMRTAVEYVRGSHRRYRRVAQLPFGEWLRKEKWVVVKATQQQQQADYFVNVLHLGRDPAGKGKLLTMNADVEKALRQHGFDGKVTTVDFSGIAAMYGGVRCSAQAFRSCAA